MYLLRRTATGLFATAALLLALVQMLPFAGELSLLGIPFDFGLSVGAAMGLAAVGAALSLSHQPKAAGSAGIAAALFAGILVLSLDGLGKGTAVAAGFALYLGATGALAASALLSFASIVEERRHGPMAPRTFRAEGATMPAAPVAPDETRPGSGSSPPSPSPSPPAPVAFTKWPAPPTPAPAMPGSAPAPTRRPAVTPAKNAPPSTNVPANGTAAPRPASKAGATTDPPVVSGAPAARAPAPTRPDASGAGGRRPAKPATDAAGPAQPQP